MAIGWIGVDLDGTLAKYDYWRGIEHIGEPIPAMASRVKKWLAEGVKVKIFTARVAFHSDTSEAAEIIGNWTLEHFGEKLEATATKDGAMVSLYDDRAVAVEYNTGKIIGKGNYHFE